jgi:hypothetical protein
LTAYTLHIHILTAYLGRSLTLPPLQAAGGTIWTEHSPSAEAVKMAMQAGGGTYRGSCTKWQGSVVLTIAIDGAGGVTGTGSSDGSGREEGGTIRGTAQPGSAAGDIELGLMWTNKYGDWPMVANVDQSGSLSGYCLPKNTALQPLAAAKGLSISDWTAQLEEQLAPSTVETVRARTVCVACAGAVVVVCASWLHCLLMHCCSYTAAHTPYTVTAFCSAAAHTLLPLRCARVLSIDLVLYI